MAKDATCYKLRYPTSSAATRVRVILRKKGNAERRNKYGRLAVYRCETCGYYHLGHTK